MEPSTRPPATRPSENPSDPAGALPQDSRLNRSELAHSPATGNSRSPDRKLRSKISRLAEELKDRSTAPAMVPAAMYGASGENAAVADLFTPFMHAMVGPDLAWPIDTTQMYVCGYTRWTDRYIRREREVF